ncbi:hypothetical protein HMI54_014881 [Coelomomyces lativittatus]|nr:hypothetical protein HMI54_014881 [Coelomomyces lativittatus]
MNGRDLSVGCRLNKEWKFIATDIDPKAVENATELVTLNQLQDRITVMLSSPCATTLKSTTLSNPLIPPCLKKSSFPKLTMTVCNPPFYEDEAHQERSRARKSTVHPITPTTVMEACTLGGEVQFVTELIQVSQEWAHQIVWFTTMLGFKSSVQTLEKTLKGLNPPPTMVVCRPLIQGRTLRYLLAWSWYLPKSVQMRYQLAKHSWTTPSSTSPSSSFVSRNMKDGSLLFEKFINPVHFNLQPSSTASKMKKNHVHWISPTCIRVILYQLFWTRAARRQLQRGGSRKKRKTEENEDEKGEGLSGETDMEVHQVEKGDEDDDEHIRKVSVKDEKVPLIIRLVHHDDWVWISGPDQDNRFQSFLSYWKRAYCA